MPALQFPHSVAKPLNLFFQLPDAPQSVINNAPCEGANQHSNDLLKGRHTLNPNK